MNKEIEFEKWLSSNPQFLEQSREVSRSAWNAGYSASQLVDIKRTIDAYARAKSDAYAEIERKLLAMAGQAFAVGKDDHAHWFRSLVNVFFRKPGDKSA